VVIYLAPLPRGFLLALELLLGFELPKKPPERETAVVPTGNQIRRRGKLEFSSKSMRVHSNSCSQGVGVCRTR
jgi:hypothetical protein